MMTENISKRCARKISAELNFNSDKEEIISYGIFGLIQIILSIVCVSIVGIMFKVCIEALIISIVMATIRKASGGVHATSPNRCIVMGTIFCVGFSLFIKYITIEVMYYSILMSMVLVYSYYTVYKLAPVDNPNKPIRKEEKRKRLKKASLLSLFTFNILILILILLYIYYDNYVLLVYSACICSGILLQIVSLTNLGHRLFNNIDVILSKFLK